MWSAIHYSNNALSRFFILLIPKEYLSSGTDMCIDKGNIDQIMVLYNLANDIHKWYTLHLYTYQIFRKQEINYLHKKKRTPGKILVQPSRTISNLGWNTMNKNLLNSWKLNAKVFIPKQITMVVENGTLIPSIHDTWALPVDSSESQKT